MGKRRDKLSQVKFRCECGHQFEDNPAVVQDYPADDWHPWRYFAPCPACGAEAQQCRRERALLKAWANATGPVTEAGKARSAANLEGHPTPEEARITRFNAMKHGLYAQVATYYPAKPGKYPQCKNCPYFDECHHDKACQKRTELFLQHHLAYEHKDPNKLRDIHARLQSLVTAVIEDIFLSIVQDGVSLKTPAWYYDKDGGFHLAEYEDTEGERRLIEEVRAHPLLKPLQSLIASNGLTLADAGMTQRSIEDQELVRGALSDENEARQQSLEYQRQQTDALNALKGLIERADQAAQADPLLIEAEHGQ